MKILLISSPTYDPQTISVPLQNHGYKTTLVNGRQEAIKEIKEHSYNVLFMAGSNDSAEDRKTINTLRHTSADYIYIVTVHKQNDPTRVDNNGSNAHLYLDTLDEQTLTTLTTNTASLHELIEEIGNNHIDFPSSGGIIARSAFNQLFLSALDRSNRYPENSALLNISIDNYQELFDMGGNYITDYAIASLSKKLTDIRRQTDIIGQIQNAKFSILFQMPKTTQEPIEAAKRFAEALMNAADLQEAAPLPVQIKITLYTIPSGQISFEQIVTPQKPTS